MNPEENNNTNPAPAAPAMPTPTPDPITPNAAAPADVPVAPVSEPIPVPEPNLTAEPTAPAEPAAPSYVFGPENPDPAANAAASTIAEPAVSPIAADQAPVEEPAPVVEEPLQPAAPVPGSIGSVVSVPENATEPDLPNPSAANPVAESPAFGEAPNAAAAPIIDDTPIVAAPVNTAPTTNAADTFVGQIPEKKQGGGAKKALIAIFIILIIIAIGIALYLLGVFDSLLGKNTSSTNPPAEQTPIVEEHTYTTVTCGHKYTTTAELSSFGNAQKASAEYVLDYVDDELSTLNYTLNISFEDSTMAKAAILNQRDSYVKAFQTLGYETDPFVSEYNNDAEASITRSAEAEDIDEKNASLIGITIADGAKLATDSASLIKNYKAAGFTCETVEE